MDCGRQRVGSPRRVRAQLAQQMQVNQVLSPFDRNVVIEIMPTCHHQGQCEATTKRFIRTHSGRSFMRNEEGKRQGGLKCASCWEKIVREQLSASGASCETCPTLQQNQTQTWTRCTLINVAHGRVGRSPYLARRHCNAQNTRPGPSAGRLTLTRLGRRACTPRCLARVPQRPR